MYSTKGVASIIGGGIAALLFERTGSWNAVFYGSAVLALCAAFIAFALRKMPLPSKPGAPEQVPMVGAESLRGTTHLK